MKKETIVDINCNQFKKDSISLARSILHHIIVVCVEIFCIGLYELIWYLIERDSNDDMESVSEAVLISIYLKRIYVGVSALIHMFFFVEKTGDVKTFDIFGFYFIFGVLYFAFSMLIPFLWLLGKLCFSAIPPGFLGDLLWGDKNYLLAKGKIQG